MRITVISGSARSTGNTQKIIEHLPLPANKKIINLSEYHISPYDYEHGYPAVDQFMALMESLIPATDLFLFATPVYWYSMSGHLKIFLDRFTDLLKINKDLGRKLRGKSMALLSSSEDPERNEGFEIPFILASDYLGMQFKGEAHFWLEEGNIFSSNANFIPDLLKVE